MRNAVSLAPDQPTQSLYFNLQHKPSAVHTGRIVSYYLKFLNCYRRILKKVDQKKTTEEIMIITFI